MNKFLFFLISLSFFQNIFSHEPIRSQNIPQQVFHAQAYQDLFAFKILYDVLKKKDHGYYLEIGAAFPILGNNTYFFEKYYNWSGISIDIVDVYKGEWQKTRKNPLLVIDATKANYWEILREFPRMIDYLSLDIDGHYEEVLNRIPFENYLFKVITIEHDSYRFGNLYKEIERIFLTSQGYYLLCPDVVYPGAGSFEDWWIHPSFFPPELFKKLSSLPLAGKNYFEIIQILNSNF